MTETHSFGYWVRRRRKALDLTQAELAGRVGCAEVTIRRIEADERRPSRQIADHLADQLEVPTDERAAFLKAARAELAADRLPTFTLPTVAPTADQSAHMPHLPGGTLTFLFTDIEGSTRLWEQHGAAMSGALARHETILREAITAHDGIVFKMVGDAVCAVFTSAPHALAATLAAQRALQAEPWQVLAQTDTPKSKIAVRMALHTGTAEVRAGEYQGLALSRTTRILSAGTAARCCSRPQPGSWHAIICRPAPSCATWARSASKTSRGPSASSSSSHPACRPISQRFRHSMRI